MGHMVVEQVLTLNATNVDTSLDPSLYWTPTMSAVSLGTQVIVNTTESGDPGSAPYVIYESVVESTSSYPPTHPSEWIRVNAINAHRMFDGRNNSRTIATDSSNNIEVTVVPEGRPKFIYFIAMRNVKRVTIQMTATAGTQAGDQRYYESDLLISYTPVGFYSWLFDVKHVDRYYRNSAGFYVAGDGLPWLSPSFDVVLEGAESSPAECGQIVVGTGFSLGPTEWGVEPTLRDYSTFEANEFGNKELIPRQNTREITGTVWVPTPDYDRVFQLFESRINQLALFDFNNGDDVSGRDVKDALRVYGKLASISGGLQYGMTPINLKIEGNS